MRLSRQQMEADLLLHGWQPVRLGGALKGDQLVWMLNGSAVHGAPVRADVHETGGSWAPLSPRAFGKMYRKCKEIDHGPSSD